MTVSILATNDHIKLDNKNIPIPKLGWVPMREALRFSGKVVSATISSIADRWFVNLNVELDQPAKPCESQAGIGVDLGVKRLATMFDGEQTKKVEGPKPLKKLMKKLKRLQRRLSSKEKGSHNRQKARTRVARLHYRIACIRQDVLYKLTSYLTDRYGAISH